MVRGTQFSHHHGRKCGMASVAAALLSPLANNTAPLVHSVEHFDLGVDYSGGAFPNHAVQFSRTGTIRCCSLYRQAEGISKTAVRCIADTGGWRDSFRSSHASWIGAGAAIDARDILGKHAHGGVSSTGDAIHAHLSEFLWNHERSILWARGYYTVLPVCRPFTSAAGLFWFEKP